MASISCHSISVPATPKPQSNPAQLRRHCLSKLHRPDSLSRSVLNLRSSVVRAANSAASSSTSRGTEQQKQEKPHVSEEEAITVDVLRRFFDLNSGKWNGSFFQFDSAGKMLHKLDTKLAVSSYGEDDLISLIQTLYIKQPSSRTSISGHVDIEPEWAEYKIKETNMFTVDKYQQIGFFPDERAFALRYQTAGMLETVLRQGVLGEDDIGEESPRNLKLPSRRPSIVCESVVYSFEKDMRVRAFHIMDPKGVLEMVLIFLEERGQGLTSHPSLGHSSDDTNRVSPFLGKWKGHSITKRSGVYGATIAEADTMVSLEMDDKGQLIQDVASTASGRDVTSNVHWTGIMLNNQVIFEGGYQVVLLPGGMYMGCPCDIGKSVAETEPFHLEFCWVESPEKRQRLVRTYDVEGMAVSTTYFYETKV